VVSSAAALGMVVVRDRQAVVAVTDATGRITVEVPDSWSRQLIDSGWDPRVLGLTAAHAPRLVVADDASRWSDLDADVDGVFVGISDDGALPAAVGRIRRSGCADGGARPYRDAMWTGQIHRWTGCGSSARSIDDIQLTAVDPARYVYVQIRQISGTDTADTVLAGLRVRG
jgi:hypothetical protein